MKTCPMAPLNPVSVKGYNVYKENPHTPDIPDFVGFMIGRGAQAHRNIIARLIPSTHMGEWHVYKDGSRTYSTTIGVYLRFEPCERLVDMVSGGFHR